MPDECRLVDQAVQRKSDKRDRVAAHADDQFAYTVQQGRRFLLQHISLHVVKPATDAGRAAHDIQQRIGIRMCHEHTALDTTTISDMPKRREFRGNETIALPKLHLANRQPTLIVTIFRY